MIIFQKGIVIIIYKHLIVVKVEQTNLKIVKKDSLLHKISLMIRVKIQKNQKLVAIDQIIKGTKIIRNKVNLNSKI